MITRLITAIVTASLAAPVLAQGGFTNFSGRDPSVREIINALKPQAPAAVPRVRTRSIKLPPGGLPPEELSAIENEEAAGAQGGAGAPTPAAVPSKVSFDQIQFEFDSARVTPAAIRLLDRIGEALASDELRGMRFLIEGHTDSIGSDAYNLGLSIRRADAVRRHLAVHHRLDYQLLVTVGRGEEEPLPGTAPTSPLNRRVVFQSQ